MGTSPVHKADKAFSHTCRSSRWVKKFRLWIYVNVLVFCCPDLAISEPFIVWASLNDYFEGGGSIETLIVCWTQKSSANKSKSVTNLTKAARDSYPGKEHRPRLNTVERILSEYSYSILIKDCRLVMSNHSTSQYLVSQTTLKYLVDVTDKFTNFSWSIDKDVCSSLTKNWGTCIYWQITEELLLKCVSIETSVEATRSA